MRERATRTNWRRPITGHKSNSGGHEGRKQAEKPTLTEQGIDVDEFIRENHARIQRLRETTPRSGIPVGAAIACDPRKPLEHDQKRDEVFDTSNASAKAKKEEPMSQPTTTKLTATEPTPENPRAIIANALIGIYDSISALQRAAYHANDKVVYMFATKLLNGELMDIKANYSKDAK